MHYSNNPASGGRHQPPLNPRPHPQNCNSHGPQFRRPPYQHNRCRPHLPHNYSDRPPGPPRGRPNFIVQLRRDSQRVVRQAEAEAVIQKLKFQPQKSNFFEDKFNVIAALLYEQWSEALGTVVQLWDMKFNDVGCSFLPRVISNIESSSDKSELNDRLKVLFIEKLKGLEEGELVQKWMKKLGTVVDEITKVSRQLSRPQKVGVSFELPGKMKGLEAERDLILIRVDEFKSGIRCIKEHLENEEKNKEQKDQVFQFVGGKIEWVRIYRLMMRECRRLDDGLPIYAHRQKIMKQIHCQQVTVLIGETGSGKSTQLVQFLADSGVCGEGSIICTQPRKLAAISLTERVKEESLGCYDGTSVICYPSYSSLQEFDYNVVFMTDHCLLQHYMRDKQLSGVSCIVVDEAHERSLNTDLLLALIKNLLCQRPYLRLIIMSATVDANQFADYFFGCRTLHVAGRNFPVEYKYEPCQSEVASPSKLMPSYVHDVLNTVLKINRTEKEGTVLAFLTSQSEVEWACDNFHASSAIALPLHGKLSYEDQHRIFQTYPNKRKVIFSTNIAETSLTIPGVRYVVDSGMVKESVYEPSTGMNILKVCRISQSSANQRAGRAGRTEPGICYRLYTKYDFESMLPHQEPEIRKVHLGVAILKIIALCVKDVREFDFVDAPSPGAIDMAVRNLIQIRAVAVKGGAYELTSEGREIVKLGVEPRLGKIILQSFRQRLGKEGLVLAAVMANSSSVFCRVGSVEAKMKSDSLKVQFCHPAGDLFTLLGVYKEWEGVPHEKRNIWCWENSINAKSLRRCQDTVLELESCLKNELNIIVPNYWYWNPQIRGGHEKSLKNIILSSLPENVAMYSGHDQLGYQVAVTKKHVQLHPSSSLFNFGLRPAWVVFSEIISVSNEYLACVTACDFDCFSSLLPPLTFDFSEMNSQRLEKRVLTGFGSVQLKRFCGKSNMTVRSLESRIRELCGDKRIGVVVDVDQNEVVLYASSPDIKKVVSLVMEALEYEKKLLRNECLEESLYIGGRDVLPSIALFGAGAKINHLELEKRCLSVDIYHSSVGSIDQKELLFFLERNTLGCICSVSKSLSSNVENHDDKWGRVTFSTPDAAKKAVELNQSAFSGGLLKVVPSRNNCDSGMMSLNPIKAKIRWPRRCSIGLGIVKCNPEDVDSMVDDFSNLDIGDRSIWCHRSTKSTDTIVIKGLSRELSEEDIYPFLRASTNRWINTFFLVRENAIDDPPLVDCQRAILREISPFLPRRNLGNFESRVEVLKPKERENFMEANIFFDASLHLEAARALEHLHGKVLPGCFSWQKIICQRLFDGSVYCPAPVYPVIKNQLDSLLNRLQKRDGVECNLQKTHTGYRVKISATATGLVFKYKKPIAELMEGTVIHHPDITPAVLQILFSREGVMIMKSVEQNTKTHIFFDKQNMALRIYGSREKIDSAKQSFTAALLALHESRQLEIRLRNGALPTDMMKRVVQHFGPDLSGLREKVAGVEVKLNTRHHTISVVGNKELKQKVESIVYELAQTSELPNVENNNDDACPICLCEIDDCYSLEDCRHKFCRSCLVEQCESGIRSHDCLPLMCTKEGCGAHILLADLKSLLPKDRLDELFRAALGAYVAASGGAYKFCPSPDCPSVYRVAGAGEPGAGFSCGACLAETCTKCHAEYHPHVSCEKYREFKSHPDLSLKEWRAGKENVKECRCGFTIEKVDGCNHIACGCGRHVCWVCLSWFDTSEDCYSHLRSVHPDDAFEFHI